MSDPKPENSLSEQEKTAREGKGWDTEIGYKSLFGNTSLFAGTMGLNMLTNMARAKVMALALGTSGVGTYWLYFGIVSFVQSFISLSISTSGVRELAEAWGKGDPARAGEMYVIVRRILLLLGLVGGVGLFVFAEYASWQVFDDAAHVGAIRCLAVVFVFSNLFIGQEALLQGSRKPGTAALAGFFSNVLATSCTVFMLAYWGMDGIIPSLIVYPVISSLVGARAAMRAGIERKSGLPWTGIFTKARGMLFLGLALTLSGVVYTWSSLWIRAYLLKKAGALHTAGLLDRTGESEVGLYSAAFAITMYATIFIASALAMEFFPRLSALRGQREKFSPLINKQTEVVIMLTAPFFLAALLFSDWLFPFLNSQEFYVGSSAFRWFLCAAMIQLIMWPMGLVRYAHKWVKLTFGLEVLSCVMHIGLVVLLYSWLGLTGLGVAFLCLRFYEYVQNLVLGHKVLGYRIDGNAARISAATLVAFVLVFVLADKSWQWLGIAVLALYCLYIGWEYVRLSGRKVFCCQKERKG